MYIQVFVSYFNDDSGFLEVYKPIICVNFNIFSDFKILSLIISLL